MNGKTEDDDFITLEDDGQEHEVKIIFKRNTEMNITGIAEKKSVLP
jgi:hypothetical protein